MKTTTKTPAQAPTKYILGFTLIELLVVISIIGVLSTMIFSSIQEARTKAQVSSIKATLRNLQTAAMTYSIDNNTFAGLCNYANTVFDESIQPHIDKLKSIAGDNRVRCIVRTSNVPNTSATHFVAADQLERKNFGVAVYYNETHYAVDIEGVMTVDKTNTGNSTNWTTANQRCINAGKRLVPVEILKAINDYGGQSFDYNFWSSTNSTTYEGFSYRIDFVAGNINRSTTTSDFRVRCAL